MSEGGVSILGKYLSRLMNSINSSNIAILMQQTDLNLSMFVNNEL